jgi:hypothetical protein
VNLLLREKALSYEVLEKYGIFKRDPIEVRFIQMSEELAESLDYVSKLSRAPEHIRGLMAVGEKQGRAFIEQYVGEGEKGAGAGEGDGKPRQQEEAAVLEQAGTT